MKNTKKFAALLLIATLAFATTACAGSAGAGAKDEKSDSTYSYKPSKPSKQQLYNNAEEIKKAMMGEWASEDGRYTLTVEKNDIGKLTQYFYIDGELVAENDVNQQEYGYFYDDRLEIGNAYYVDYLGDLSANLPFYIDGDKLLFYDNAGNWVRMNRVGVEGTLAGHSDLYIEKRAELIGYWWDEETAYWVEFVNGDADGKFYLGIHRNEDNVSVEEMEFLVKDIVMSSDEENVDSMGLDFVVVAEDSVTSEEVKFPFSCEKNTSLSIVIDGRIIELKNLISAY